MTIPVSDHIAITRLMYRYARCADEKDYAGFGDVFCDDAVFIYMGNPVSTLPQIQQMMHALEDYPQTLHQVTNVLFDVREDEASGQTYCLASHMFTEGEQGKKLDMGIIYDDDLLRTKHGWRIKQRKFTMLWTQTSDVEIPDV